ncbi:MAG: EboA domain-containing protein [Sulfitobacter sp.]
MTSPKELLKNWILAQVGSDADWIVENIAKIEKGCPERDLHIFLGLAPRRLGKADLVLTENDLCMANTACPGWNPTGWSIDGATRVLALLSCPSNRPFSDRFKDLRRTADLAELIAFYRGLPLYPQPETLGFEVGEGLRSNIKAVFEAIAHNNPYPRDYFDDHRWNHMILKALFVDSRLSPILGLEDRANAELARILVDYAQERRAAGRTVSDELWIPVRPFQDDPEIAVHLPKDFS